ncbi:hypothetical protein D3C71_1771260 [compost metagenome]
MAAAPDFAQMTRQEGDQGQGGAACARPDDPCPSAAVGHEQDNRSIENGHGATEVGQRIRQKYGHGDERRNGEPQHSRWLTLRTAAHRVPPACAVVRHGKA